MGSHDYELSQLVILLHSVHEDKTHLWTSKSVRGVHKITLHIQYSVFQKSTMSMCRLSITPFFFCLWLVGNSSKLVTTLDTEFIVSLYQMLALKENGSNLIMSPASILLNLALLQLGARGNTLAQLERTMGYNINDSTFQDHVYHTRGDLENSSHSVRLQLTNTLLIQIGVQLLPEFTNHAMLWCNSSLVSMNFSHPSGTHAPLQQESPSRADEMKKEDEEEEEFSGWAAVQMALLSSVMFQGAWQKQFLFTEINLPFILADGSTVKVPMMYQSAEARFGQFRLPSDQPYSVLELPYLGRSLSLLVAMPSEKKTSLSQLESQLTGRTVELWDTRLRHAKMDIFLPRFKMHSRFNLKPTLQSLGISDAFRPSAANFRGISDTEGLYISEAIHEATIEVTEDGTTATAATAMVLLKRSRAPVFKADRPFLFIIRHVNGSVLFIGRVLNPAEQVH